MKLYLLMLLKYFARAMYAPMKLLPTTHKVVLISRKNSQTSIDFQMLYDRMNNLDPTLRVVILNHKMQQKFTHLFAIAREMYHLATAKACIVDSYIISVSILRHKKSLRVVQMWHALGALKKFGHLAIDRRAGSSSAMAEVMHMHRNYDYVCAGSVESAKIFAKAFNVPISKVKPVGMPRVDYLLDKNVRAVNKKNILAAYPELSRKPVILYAPTFRKRSKINPQTLIDAVDTTKYALVIKQHPLDKTHIKQHKGVVIESSFDILQLLSVADFVITDYSACSFEAALLNIPVHFWVYDKATYKKSLGLVVDPSELPGVVSEDAVQIVNSINKNTYNYGKLKAFRQKYVALPNDSCTDAVIKLTGVVSRYAFAQETVS